LRGYIGQTLAEVAEARGTSVADTAMDLVIEDGSRVQVVYFLMSEENVARQIALPWVSFCSDAGSYATEGVFLNTSTHPRAYGNFARLLGRYVRDERVIPLEEAVRKLTSLPATNLRIRDRGQLAPGFFADVVAFDPATIQDRATYEEPHQYAVGMVHVWVNGTPVLQDGDHTGATPGRALRGPGWTGWAETSAEATEGGR
jgi:N-acyl-D-amino-acid deacylase